MKKVKASDFIECSKCHRQLDIEVYGAFPSEDTPAVLITYIEDDHHPSVSVQCANCGQYTVYRRSKKKA
jgi:hypothetical protein